MKTVLDWNQGWVFSKKSSEDVDPGILLSGAEPVSVPHTWYVDGEYYQGDGIYQKVFTPDLDPGQRMFCRFYGVDKVCSVFLNGQKIGGHEGGYSIFALEMTHCVKNHEQNILTVIANNEKGDHVNPLSGDFTIFGGIIRRVEMIIAEQTCFDYTYYGTDGVLANTVIGEPLGDDRPSEGIVRVKSYILMPENDPGKKTIRYELWDHQGQLAGRSDGIAGEETAICIDDPVRWNGRNDPYVYTLSATLLDEGRAIDKVEKRVGFRSIRLDSEKGFFLNGDHIKLNGVAKHQDSAGVFAAAGPENWDRDMELICEIGANAVRLSHYQHPQYIYDKCDQMGLVVWAEVPVLKMTQHPELFENARHQLKELILQNMHHPSICFWGLQNEIAIFGEQPYMHENVKQLNQLAKFLDPSRFTAGANLNTVEYDSPLNKITDTTAYNIYFGWYYGEMEDYGTFLDGFHRENPEIPLAISEYGVDCNLQFHSAHPTVKDYSEEFQSVFHETVYPQMQSRDYVWGTFVWNMFDFVSGVRDEGGVKYRNNKGLVTHDRAVRKDSFYYYKALWSREPFVHIAEKRFQKRDEAHIRIKVYSNMPDVTLCFDGREQKRSSDHGVFIFDPVPLKEGDNVFAVYAGNLKDEAVFTKVDAPEKAYAYTDPNPGLNVRNWFTDEAEKEKLFPAGKYSIMDTINVLLDNNQVMKLLDSGWPKVGAYMRDTIGTFTLEQAAAHSKTICTAEELKEMNQCLTQISK